mmetsp:Transcript_47828/g.94847  ORF Transcript_47828/g.94847 Transcript_47828/m.94847 type:complete len:165 (-) Transcript_47828:7-501(-)
MEVIKLSTLLIKTLSKPLAKGLKTRLTTNLFWTARTIDIGQFTHKYWSLLQIRAAGHKTLRVKPLDEAAALNQGADMVSEGFVFGVAALAMLFELNRSNAAKVQDGLAKKAKELEATNKLDRRLRGIEDRLERMEEAQKEAERALAAAKSTPTNRTSPWWAHRS